MGCIIDNVSLLSDVTRCVAIQFGENCEVVLHDLMPPYSKTIVVIQDGCVTGRKIGDDGTNAGLQTLKGSASPGDQYHYINTTPDNRILRSSSRYSHDECEEVNGSLCINLDIINLIRCQDSLRLLAYDESELPTHNSSEFFVGNIDGLLEEMMSNAVSKAGKEIKGLTREEKVNIIRPLDRRRFFLIEKSAEILVDFLKLSRYSIYNYLNEIK